MLVEQIQIRKYVYLVWRPVAVKWSGGEVDEADLLENVIAVKDKPGVQPPRPSAIPTWEVGASGLAGGRLGW